MKIKIKNYQAIKDAELEIKNGITTIVGPTNSGKSALIRAVEAAINNKSGSSFINYDADFAEVTIEDQGHSVTWHKNRKNHLSHYKIDDREINKIGVKQLDEVGELLGMQELVINNEKLRLNFWKQMTPPFLVDKSSFQLFEFISKSEYQETVTAVRESTQDVIKELDKDINSLHTLIDSETARAIEYKEKLESLDKFVKFDVDKLEMAVNLQKSIIDELDKIIDYGNKILELELKLSTIDNKITKLSKVHEEVGKHNELLTQLTTFVEQYNNSKTSLDRLTTNLEDIQNKQTVLEDKVKKFNNLKKQIEEAEEPIKMLNEHMSNYNTSKSMMQNLQNRITEADRQLKAAEQELSEFDYCPTCKQPLSNHNHKEVNHG